MGVDNNQILLFIIQLSCWNVYSILSIPKKRDASDLKYILTNITYEILLKHFINRIQIFVFAVSSGNGELENFFGCASKYLIFLIYYCLHCVAIHIDCAETVPIIVVIMDIDIYNPKYLTEYHSDNTKEVLDIASNV